LVEFTIRRAVEGDYQAIRSLIHAVQINPMGLDWRRFQVAVTSGNSLLGCGQIKPHGDGSRELASIAVREGYRGQGLARAIIDDLLRLDSQRPLYLMCRARLRPLYNKFGFHDITLEELPPYFKRIKRAERLFNSGAPPQNRLLVMRLD
jgi:N-acetylglutamate synthase-like GNAT family acetyltransferase